MPVELDFWADNLDRMSYEIDPLEDRMQNKDENISNHLKEHLFSIFEKK